MPRPAATQLKDGRYQVKVTIAPRTRISVYGRTPEEAQDEAERVKKRVAEGKSIPPKNLTLAQFVMAEDGWLSTVVRPNLAPRAAIRYEEIMRLHVLPVLGRKKLTAIGPKDVQALIAHLTTKELSPSRPGAGRNVRKLSPATVRRVYEVLRNALNVALDWELVTRNPALRARLPAQDEEESPTLTAEQSIRLIETAIGSQLECIVTLALTTGLRQAELLGLHWDAVDLERGFIRVRSQVQRIPHESIQEFAPKTRRSRRIVLLTPLGKGALLRQRERIAGMREEAEILEREWEEKGLVHPNRVGREIEAGNLHRRWKALLSRAGLPDMRFHDLRHSTATLLHSLGVSLAEIQEILGHSSITVTSDIYRGRVMPLHVEAMAKLGGLLAGPDSPLITILPPAYSAPNKTKAEDTS